MNNGILIDTSIIIDFLRQPTNAYAELETIVGGLHIIPLTEEISKIAGRIKALQGIDLIDAIIAATALQANTSLMTLNTKHFEQIENLEIYN